MTRAIKELLEDHKNSPDLGSSLSMTEEECNLWISYWTSMHSTQKTKSFPQPLEQGSSLAEAPKQGFQYYTIEEAGFWIPLSTEKYQTLLLNSYYRAKDVARAIGVIKIAAFCRQDGEIYDFILGGWRK